MFRKLSLLLGFLAFASTAFANAPPSPPPVSVLSGSVNLNATSTTSQATLPSTNVAAIALTICNVGAKDAFVAYGTNSIVATTASPVVKSGGGIVVWSANATTVAAITAGSDTTTLTIYQGNGPLAQCPTGSNASDGGGTAQGAPNAGGALAWPVIDQSVINAIVAGYLTAQLPPLPIVATSHNVTLTTGGTAQIAIGANSNRKGGWCKNIPESTENAFFSITGTASTTPGSAANSDDEPPNGSFNIPPGITSAVSVNAASTGHVILCTELQ